MRVRIAVNFDTSGLDASEFRDRVQAIEDLGFDSIWVAERLTSPLLDPLTALGVAAGATRKLKLGTAVTVLPGRNPVPLAKAFASLDVLSGGRFLPAVGLGMPTRAEQAAFGVERAERAPWLDEALPLMRRIWQGGPIDHHGPRFHYAGLCVLPTPVQSPLPVWLGGRAPSELRRVGRLGDGWLAAFVTPEEAGHGREAVGREAAKSDRRIDEGHYGAIVPYVHGEIPGELASFITERGLSDHPAELVPVGYDALVETIGRFTENGISKFVVQWPRGRRWSEELGDLAEAVLPLQS